MTLAALVHLLPMGVTVDEVADPSRGAQDESHGVDLSRPFVDATLPDRSHADPDQ